LVVGECKVLILDVVEGVDCAGTEHGVSLAEQPIEGGNVEEKKVEDCYFLLVDPLPDRLGLNTRLAVVGVE